MTKSRTSDRDQSVVELDDAALSTVVGGAAEGTFSPQLALAAYPVGGWTMRDVFARPQLGKYTPR